MMERYQTELRNKNRGYMNLIVWQKAIDLFGLAWKMAFVEARIDFKLRAQFADAAQSISANISEGYGRRSVYHSITPSLHHSITPPLHHSITPSARAHHA